MPLCWAAVCVVIPLPKPLPPLAPGFSSSSHPFPPCVPFWPSLPLPPWPLCPSPPATHLEPCVSSLLLPKTLSLVFRGQISVVRGPAMWAESEVPW